MLNPLISSLALTLAVALSPTAVANDIFVNPTTGTDAAGSGLNPSRPVKTLSFASNMVNPTDTIFLAAGDYNTASGEIFPITLPAGVHLQGAGQGLTNIQRIQPALTLTPMIDVGVANNFPANMLRDLTLFQNNGTPIALVDTSHALDVQDCTFNGSHIAIMFEGWNDTAEDNIRVVNCTFSGQVEAAMEVFLIPDATAPATFTFTGNTADQVLALEVIEAFPNSVGNANVTIQNNTFTGFGGVHAGQEWANLTKADDRDSHWLLTDNQMGDMGEGLGLEYNSTVSPGTTCHLLVEVYRNIANTGDHGAGFGSVGAGGGTFNDVLFLIDDNDFSGLGGAMEV